MNSLYPHRFDSGARFYWVCNLLECVYPFTQKDGRFLTWPSQPVFWDNYWDRRN